MPVAQELERPNQVDLKVVELQPGSKNKLPSELRDALRTVQIVSRSIGREMGSLVVEGSSDVSQEPNLYIFNGRAEKSGPLLGLTFSFAPALLSGAADSAHNVLSGRFDLNFKNRRQPKIVDVAIKCYSKRDTQDRFDRAQREIYFMQKMKSLGEPTLTPAALAVAPDDGRTHGEVILITEYDPTIMTYDNQPWKRGFTPDNVEAARSAIHALGHFNADLGILHGDAKIKNIATDESGKAAMIDFETSREIDPANPIEASEAAVQDLGLFFTSLIRKGFLKPTESESANFANALTEEYLAYWAHHPGEVQDQVFSSAVSVLDSLELAA